MLSQPDEEPAPPFTVAIDAAIVARARRLRQTLPFARLGDQDLAMLASAAHGQHYVKGQMIFLEGEECRGIHVLESGVVKLFTQTAGDAPESGLGREQTLRFLAVGDIFNEVPVFDGGPNPVSAEAIEASRALLIPVTTVRRLLRTSPAFAEAMTADLAGRVRQMLALVQDLSLRHVAGRIAKVLLQTIYPVQGVGIGAERRQRLTQREMAEMAGTVREVAARTLKQMERDGAIAIDGGRITILDPTKLAALL